MKGRGLIPEEEKRSYSAVFLFLVCLLALGTAWAVWQDVFSRHLWKSYKSQFFELAIENYTEAIQKEDDALASDEDYRRLRQELADLRRNLSQGELARRLSDLRQRAAALDVRRNEADLDLRIVKGEVEEAWYHVEHAERNGLDDSAERAVLRDLQGQAEQARQRLEHIDAERDELARRIADIQGREGQILDELHGMERRRERLVEQLDSVSRKWPLLGRVAFVPTVEQVVLEDLDRDNFGNWVDRVDRCVNCHVAIDRPGFEDLEQPFATHPDREYYLGNHEVRRFGCTPCHGGQGPAMSSVEQAHGKVAFWEDPLLDLQGKVQSRCLSCHRSVQGFKGAEIAARGERLFERSGCGGCHLVEGFEELRPIGPSLERIAAKVEPEWLLAWLQDPRKFRPRSMMPDFFLPRNEAVAIAAYLIDASLEESLNWLDSADLPQPGQPDVSTVVDEGRVLTRQLGCLGCHGFSEDEYSAEVAHGRDVAPNLSRIGEKVGTRWIYNWIRDPKGYSPASRMPNLRLTEEEGTSVQRYLSSLKALPPAPRDVTLRKELADPSEIAQGAKLIRKYGCYGCHLIPGFKDESRVSVELTTVGSKPVEELFFGNRTDIAQTWDAWTLNKLLAPRVYATERIEQNMPDFGFSEDDAEALLIFLASKTEQRVNVTYLAGESARMDTLIHGRRLMDHYNCRGCHSLDGYEGDIRRYYAAKTEEEDAMEFAPPILEGEGAKVTEGWLFDFLMKPIRMRPWLDVRMPSFGLSGEDAAAIVDYFSNVDGYRLGPVVIEAEESAGPAEEAFHSLIPEGVFDCYACHVQRAEGPADESLVVSDYGLPPERMKQWVSENLGSEDSASMSASQHAEALRRYLDTGGR